MQLVQCELVRSLTAYTVPLIFCSIHFCFPVRYLSLNIDPFQKKTVALSSSGTSRFKPRGEGTIESRFYGFQDICCARLRRISFQPCENNELDFYCSPKCPPSIVPARWKHVNAYTFGNQVWVITAGLLRKTTYFDFRRRTVKSHQLFSTRH